MKVLSSVPTSTQAVTGNWTAVNSVDHADAVNDVTTFSVATIPDLQGNTYYANSSDPYQLFTAWTYATEPTVGIRSQNAIYPANPNDGTPTYFAVTSATSSDGYNLTFTFTNGDAHLPVINSLVSITGFSGTYTSWNVTKGFVTASSLSSAGNGSMTVNSPAGGLYTGTQATVTNVYATQSYANSGGDYFAYVADISSFREGQMVAILEGLQSGQVPYTPSATSTDAFYSEWIEYATSGLVPTVPYKQTIDPVDFPISSLMSPQSTATISAVMLPNLSFYNPPSNKYLGRFFSPTSQSPYTPLNYTLLASPTPYNIGNNIASPVYVASSGDSQAISNLATILPDNTISAGHLPTISLIAIGYLNTSIALSSTEGFSVGQTLTLSMLPTTSLTPAPMGWHAGKIISISGNYLITDLTSQSTAFARNGTDGRLPNAYASATGVLTNGSPTITSVSSTAGFAAGMFIYDDSHYIPNTSYVVSVGTNSITMSQNATRGSGGAETILAGGQAIGFNVGVTSPTASWGSGTAAVSLSSTAGVYQGMYVQGEGIPNGITVSSVGSGGIFLSDITTGEGFANSTPLSITPSQYQFPYSSSFTDYGSIVGGSKTYFPYFGDVQGSFLSGEKIHGSNIPSGTTINNLFLQEEFVSGMPTTFTATTTSTSYTATSVSTFQKVAIGQSVSGTGIPTGTVITGMDTNAATVTLSNLPTVSGSTTFTTALFPAQTFVVSGTYTVSGTSYRITPSTLTQLTGIMIGMPVYTMSVGDSSAVKAISGGAIYLTSELFLATSGDPISANIVNGAVTLSASATTTLDRATVATIDYTIPQANALAFGATIENATARLNTSSGNKFDATFFTAPYQSVDGANNPNHGGYIIMPTVFTSVRTPPLANALGVATHTPTSGVPVNGISLNANFTNSVNFIGSVSSSATSVTAVNPSSSWPTTFASAPDGWALWGITTSGTGVTPTPTPFTVTGISVSGTVATISFTGGHSPATLNNVPMYITAPVQVPTTVGLSVGQIISSDATPFISPAVNGVVGSRYTAYPFIISINKNAKTVSVTGDVSYGSSTIVNVSTTAGLMVGQYFSSNGYFPADTEIVSIDSATQVTVSNNAVSTLAGASLTFNYYNIHLGSYANGGNDEYAYTGYQGYSIPSTQNNVFAVAGNNIIGGNSFGNINTYTLTVDNTTNLSLSTSSSWTGTYTNGYNGITGVSPSATQYISVGDAVALPPNVFPTFPAQANTNLNFSITQGSYSNAFVSAVVSNGTTYTVFLEDTQGDPYSFATNLSSSGTFTNYTPSYVAGNSRLVVLGIDASINEIDVWAVDGSDVLLGGNTTSYPNGDNQNAIYPVENTVSVYSAFTTPTSDGQGAGVVTVKGNIVGNHAPNTIVASYDEGDRYFGSDTVGDVETITPTTVGALFGTTLATDLTSVSKSVIVNPLNNTGNHEVGGTYYDQYGNVASQGAPSLTGVTVSNCIVVSGENYITAPQTSKDVTVGWLASGTGIPRNTFVSAIRGSQIYLTSNISVSSTTANITFTPQVWGVMIVGKGGTQEALIFNGSYTFLSGLSSGNTTSPISVPLATGQAFQYKHFAGEPVTVANITTSGFVNQHAQGAPILGSAEDSVNLQGKQTLIADNSAGAVSTLNSTTLLTSPTWLESGSNGSASMNNRFTKATPSGSTILSIANNDLFPSSTYNNVFNTGNFCPPEIGRVAGFVSGTSVAGTSYFVPFVPSGKPLPQGNWFARIGTDVVQVSGVSITDDTSITPSGYFLLVTTSGNNIPYFDGTPIHLKSLDIKTTYDSLTVPHFYLNRSFSGIASTVDSRITSVSVSSPISSFVSATAAGTGAGQTTFTYTYASSDPMVGMEMFGYHSIPPNTIVTAVDVANSLVTFNNPLTEPIYSGSIIYFAFAVRGNGIPTGTYIQTYSGGGGGYTPSVYLMYASLLPSYPTVNGAVTFNIDASLYVSGVSVETIYTTPQTCAMDSGMNLYLKYGPYSQTVTTSAAIAIGDTTISVNAFVPAFNFISSDVTDGVLTDSIAGVGFGTLGTFSLYAPLQKNQVLVLGSGTTTQQITVHAPVAPFATDISVEPFTPNYNYDDATLPALYTGTAAIGSSEITSFSVSPGFPAIGTQLVSTVFDTATFVLSVSGSTVTVSTPANSDSDGFDLFYVYPTTFTSPTPLTITSGKNYETVYPYTIPARQTDGTYEVQIASPTINSYDVDAILALYAPPASPEAGDVRYVPQTDTLEKFDGTDWRKASVASVSIISAIQGADGGGDKHSISLVDTTTNTVAPSDTYVNQKPAQTM